MRYFTKTHNDLKWLFPIAKTKKEAAEVFNYVEENAKNALICYQNAERYLYDMVAGGNAMYKKSLQAAIDGQEKAREKLASLLPKQGRRID